jgi:hypothetical protein
MRGKGRGNCTEVTKIAVVQNVLRDLPKMKMQMGEGKRYLKRRRLDKYIQ